jgi:hypothetical protein
VAKEIFSAVDEMNVNTKPRRTRVLRASDVIPPFGKNVSQAKGGDTEAEQIGSVPSEPSNTGGVSLLNEATAEVAQRPAGPAEIPTYDLAENILAEQRRAASRRRRAPGRVEDEPVARSGQVRPGDLTADLPSGDLLTLQRTVAEIVARDIERLCRRPHR